MAAVAPPSYDSIYGKVQEKLDGKPTPEKVLQTVANLEPHEIDAIKNAPFDYDAAMSKVDKDAFQQGVENYLATDAAQARLRINAEAATQSCKLIDTMFSNLAVKLGEVDAKNSDNKDRKFMPEFVQLQKDYRSVLYKSKELAVTMSSYGLRFKETILPICLDSRVKKASKEAKLDQCIQMADGFGKESQDIMVSFDGLRTLFGSFTGSFNSWATEAEKKLDADMDKITKEIDKLKDEIEEYRGLMVKYGVIGGIATVGVTAGLCVFLGPFGLLAGLIGAGVTIGFMVHWSCKITDLQSQVQTKEKRFKELKSEKDSIVATRHQLALLGSDSLKVFNTQIGHLNAVWEFAKNDCTSIKLELNYIEANVDDVSDESLRLHILPRIGKSMSLYETMAVYLQRYADGISAADIPSPNA